MAAARLLHRRGGRAVVVTLASAAGGVPISKSRPRLKGSPRLPQVARCGGEVYRDSGSGGPRRSGSAARRPV